MPAHRTSSATSSRLLLLPEDLLSVVVGQLACAQALGRCCATCKRLDRLASSDVMWLPLLQDAQSKQSRRASLTPTERRLTAAAATTRPTTARRCKTALRSHLLLIARDRRWELRRSLTAAEERQKQAATRLCESRAKLERLRETMRKRAAGPFWRAPQQVAVAGGSLDASCCAMDSSVREAAREVDKFAAVTARLWRRCEEQDAAVRRLMTTAGSGS